MYTKRFSLQVGRLIKNQIKNEIVTALFNEGFGYSVQEQMGWIDGILLFEITHKNEEKLNIFQCRVDQMLRNIPRTF